MRVVDFKNDVASTNRRLADLPNRVVEGDPHHEIKTRFISPDGTLVVGTWTSTPGKWIAFADRDEFCVLVSGHIKLIADDGTEQEFRSGDSFLIPNGFRGFWHVLEKTTKQFVVRNYIASS